MAPELLAPLLGAPGLLLGVRVRAKAQGQGLGEGWRYGYRHGEVFESVSGSLSCSDRALKEEQFAPSTSLLFLRDPDVLYSALSLLDARSLARLSVRSLCHSVLIP